MKGEGSWLLVAQGHRDMGRVSQVSPDPWSLTLHRDPGFLSAYGDEGHNTLLETVIALTWSLEVTYPVSWSKRRASVLEGHQATSSVRPWGAGLLQHIRRDYTVSHRTWRVTTGEGQRALVIFGPGKDLLDPV